MAKHHLKIKTFFSGTRNSNTVLPVKSDSDGLFTKLSIRDLESIDHLCIYPIRRSVQVKMFLNTCKQNITSLSLLVGTTVVLPWYFISIFPPFTDIQTANGQLNLSMA